MPKSDLKRHWEPSEAAFQRLLSWLGETDGSEGEHYLEMRERLVHYFARRNGPAPDDLADETLNRVARRLEETGAIDDIVPARYCYIVAKFVLLESQRQRDRQSGLPPEAGLHTEEARTAQPDAAADERERTHVCLERCLDTCTPAERRLILEYYRTPSGSAREQRKALADRLG